MFVKKLVQSLARKHVLLILPALFAMSNYAAAETCPTAALSTANWTADAGNIDGYVRYQYDDGTYSGSGMLQGPLSQVLPSGVMAVASNNVATRLLGCNYQAISNTSQTSNFGLQRNINSPITLTGSAWTFGKIAATCTNGIDEACSFTIGAPAPTPQTGANPFGTSKP